MSVVLPSSLVQLGHAAYQHPLFWFAALILFRYTRLVVHIISFWLYRPASIPEHPTITTRDVTVILPTVDPQNQDFKECVKSCFGNKPYEVLIVTVGRDRQRLCEEVVSQLETHGTRVQVLRARVANKRHQVSTAIPHVESMITLLLDDHVFWPSSRFLPTVLAPFEDPAVGAVGMNKRVRRTDRGFNKRSFWNMIGAIYLERHNFEIRATNTIDGGVFVVSGRTSLHRTAILQDPKFLKGFNDERFLFGLFGPLNPDDDNKITRFEVSQGWKIKIQYGSDAVIETTLGTYPKFLSQCLRWVRTTWRSNSCSLFTDRTVWFRQPWCVYAVYITSFFNFALFNDFGLSYLLSKSPYGTWQNVAILWGWILATKMVKLTPYFLRHPEDLRMLPGYFVFAYYHSLIKLYALLTFWNCDWSGRDLKAINGDEDRPGSQSRSRTGGRSGAKSRSRSRARATGFEPL